MDKRVPRNTKVVSAALSLVFSAVVLVATPACAVRRTTRVSPPDLPRPAQEASTSTLVDRTDAWSEHIQSVVATVDLEPTVGSIYSGVIREYQDVRGFILFEKPAMIRMIGQAPVVRTEIFDMVSDGVEFRLYVPLKEKFIVGKTTSSPAAKNSLENLRPQHILEALLIPPIDPTREQVFRVPEEQGGHRYYVLNIVDPTQNELSLKQRVWFDRSDLEIVRVQIYGPDGALNEDVQYSQYQNFEGVHYPRRIQIGRPVEDYRLSITLLKATFNQPIAPEKFQLKKPEKAELVELAAARAGEESRGQ